MDVLAPAALSGGLSSGGPVAWPVGDDRWWVSSLSAGPADLAGPAVSARRAVDDAVDAFRAAGASPAFALDLLAFPVKETPLENAEALLGAASARLGMAGWPLCGGHTLDHGASRLGLVLNGLLEGPPGPAWRAVPGSFSPPGRKPPRKTGHPRLTAWTPGGG